jgi:hypothetical protein
MESKDNKLPATDENACCSTGSLAELITDCCSGSVKTKGSNSPELEQKIKALCEKHECNSLEISTRIIEACKEFQQPDYCCPSDQSGKSAAELEGKCACSPETKARLLAICNDFGDKKECNTDELKSRFEAICESDDCCNSELRERFRAVLADFEGKTSCSKEDCEQLITSILIHASVCNTTDDHCCQSENEKTG